MPLLRFAELRLGFRQAQDDTDEVGFVGLVENLVFIA